MFSELPRIVLQFASGLALCYPKDSGTCPGSFQPYLEEILPQQQQQQDGESTVYYAGIKLGVQELRGEIK